MSTKIIFRALSPTPQDSDQQAGVGREPAHLASTQAMTTLLVLGPQLGKCGSNRCWALAKAGGPKPTKSDAGPCPQRVDTEAADPAVHGGQTRGQPALNTDTSEESHAQGGDRADGYSLGTWRAISGVCLSLGVPQEARAMAA